MTKKLLLFLGLLVSSYIGFTQTCAAPTSHSLATIVHATCPGAGELTVSGMTPTVASLPAGDYYEYQLTDVSANVLAAWQTSPTFSGLEAGTYRIQMRRYCTATSGYSSVYAPTTNRIINPAVSSFSVTRTDAVCAVNSGSLEITSTTPASNTLPAGDYYEYQLTDVSSNVLAPWQTASVFSGLIAGTYRIEMRRYCTTSNGFSDVHAPGTNYIVYGPVVSISTTIVNELCPGAGEITISSINPTSASLPSGDYYEYQLTNTSANVIAAWQPSFTFSGLIAGTYRIQIRRYCTSTASFNDIYAPATNYTVQPAITSLSVATFNEYCPGEGKLVVSSVSPAVSTLATGDYYEYQLTDISSNVIQPWQLSNTFTGLTSGTYRVQMRRYCGASGVYSAIYAPTTNRTISANITSHSVTVSNEFCAANGGLINITSVTPIASILNPSDYYEYQLTEANGLTIVRPWQTSPVFSNVPVGYYRVQIRAWCSASAAYSVLYAPITLRTISAGTGASLSSMGSNTVLRHETCPGNAIIKAGLPTPTPENLPTGEYYEYRLVLASDTTQIIKAWQPSDTFQGGINDGVYKVQVRRICPGNTGATYTHPTNVTILEQVVPANITSITINRTASSCCDGMITINATGSGPREYALVSSLNAPDVPASLVIPRQSSEIIDGLCAGTHYVRVWDACGGYATQAVTITAYTNVPSITLTNNAYYRYACDSLRVSFTLNNIRRFINLSDTETVRAWITWPDNSTDTITLPNGNLNGNYGLWAIFNYSKLDPAYNPALPFPANISGWPKTITYGYRDNCGTVYTWPHVINPGPLTMLHTLATTGCDSVSATFRLYHNTPVSGGGIRVFGAYSTSASSLQSPYVYMNADVKYSIDGGTTWNDAVGSGYANNSRSIQLARGTTYQLMVAYCNDTLTQNITVPTQPGLANNILRIEPGSNNDCSATIEIGSVSSAFGDSVVVEMLSANPAISPLPEPVTVQNQIGVDVFTGLPPGTYTFMVTDSIGTECPRSSTQTITITQLVLNVSLIETNLYACKDNSGMGISVPTNNGAENRPVTFEVLSQPSGSTVPDSFTFNIPTPTNITTRYRIPELYNLIPGNYEFRITDSSGTAATCPRSIVRSLTIIVPMVNEFTLGQQCNGALEINQTNTLIDFNTSGTWIAEVYNSSNVKLWNGTGTGSTNARNFLVPQNTVNSWPNGTYTIRVYNNSDGNGSINDSCTITENTWVKMPIAIDPSPSMYFHGCDGDSANATIIGMATGSLAQPYSWVLYTGPVPHQDSIIAGPRLDNVFTGLMANKTYLLAVSDTCGFGQNYVISVSNSLRIFATSATNTQCAGEDVNFSVPNIAGATYQWYKDSNPIPGATTHELQLTNIQVATHAGYYRVEVEMPDCDLTSNHFQLRVDCSALPVTLTSFTAHKKDKTSELKWSTVKELHNKGFDIERSTDGRQWTKLGFVASTADKNTVTAQHYTYTDHAPLKGQNIYRLKQTDMDGSTEYSAVRTVWFDYIQKDINIHPNPAREHITVSGLDGTERISVWDVVGKRVYEAQASGSTLIIPMHQLTEGIYYIRVMGVDGQLSSHKIIKTN